MIDEFVTIDLEKPPIGVSVVFFYQQQQAIRVVLMRSNGDSPDVPGHIDLVVPRRFSESGNEVTQLIQLLRQSGGTAWPPSARNNVEQLNARWSPL